MKPSRLFLSVFGTVAVAGLVGVAAAQNYSSDSSTNNKSQAIQPQTDSGTPNTPKAPAATTMSDNSATSTTNSSTDNSTSTSGDTSSSQEQAPKVDRN